ncbi:MAG TPA: hypothetical protein VJ323_15425, partial [Bryobacteraceae bacterium]|nr:hypothetical protein [Bryobacteraceae bacterium]
STIVLPRIDPYSLGALVALYEHKVYVQGVMWGLNSFDQWGVELGKGIAQSLIPVLAGEMPGTGVDGSTHALIDRLRISTENE